MDMLNLSEGLAPPVKICIDEHHAHREALLMNSPELCSLNNCKFEQLKLESGHYTLQISHPNSRMEGVMTITYNKTKQPQRMKTATERIDDCL